MNTDSLFDSLFDKVSNKTIAVIYIFEREDSPGYTHYDIWKSDVLEEWLNAIRQLNGVPYILDLKSFINQAVNNRLPHIDTVINLNNGSTVLSTLSLVPSICSFFDIPCIPCNSEAIIAGENKLFSNSLASYNELILPKNGIDNTDNTIYRPLNFGSSHGVKRNYIGTANRGLYQEFIKGYDITTPILFNPVTDCLEVLPTVMYYPEDKDINWFFNEKAKENRGGYDKAILHIDKETSQKYIELAKSLSIDSYCRIDSRIMCNSANEWDLLFNSPVSSEQIRFIEINPMPTLKQNINFFNSIEALEETSSFYGLYQSYINKIKNSSPLGFILFCSLLSKLKPSVKEKWI